MSSMLGSIPGSAASAASRIGEAMTSAYHGAAGATSVVARHAGYVAVAAGEEVRKQGEALSLMLPYKRVVGAVAGHLVHQSAAVGVPTFLREMAADAMLLSMRHLPPDHAVALQVAVGTFNVGLQFLRRHQEARNPEEAARGFHAITPEQWAQIPQRERHLLAVEQDKHSRMIFSIQLLASLTHIGIGAYAATSKDPALAALPTALLVGDLKAIAYAVMRDTVQASFSMVGMKNGAATEGLIGPPLTASAAAYSMITTVGNYGFTYLPPFTPKGILATAVLTGNSDELTRSEAWQARAAINAVKGAINALVHTSDWSFMTQQEANQWGAEQEWNPKLRLLDRSKHDYSRLLDATPVRLTLIAGSNAMTNTVALLTRSLPDHASTAILNMMGGAYEGLMYKTIGNTWQAQAAVRAAAASSRAPEPASLAAIEAGRESGRLPPITASSVREGQG